MPLPDLGSEEEPVAEDQVGDVAEVGRVVAEAADGLQQEVEVEGHEADSRNLARVKAVLVEKVRDVRGYLDDWQTAAGEVRDVHEDCEVVHGLRHRYLELLGERRLGRVVQDQGGQIHQGLAVAGLPEAPRAADKMEATGPAVSFEERTQGRLDIPAGEVADPVRDGQPGGPVARRYRPRRQPRAVCGDSQASEAPVHAGDAHFERIGEVRGGAAARDVHVNHLADAERGGGGAGAQRELTPRGRAWPRPTRMVILDA